MQNSDSEPSRADHPGHRPEPAAPNLGGGLAGRRALAAALRPREPGNGGRPALEAAPPSEAPSRRPAQLALEAGPRSEEPSRHPARLALEAAPRSLEPGRRAARRALEAGRRPPGVPYVPAHSLPRGSRPRMPIRAIAGIAVGVVALVALIGGIAVTGVVLLRGDGGGAGDDGALSEVVDYRQTSPAALSRDHMLGRITYPMTPPAGGPHNAAWQNCEGNVYSAPIANENAVHSLEHGAVWITYAPGLPRDQVATLADKVRGRNFLFMSPYPGQDRAISLQAWGYQLKVDTAADAGVDAFIQRYRETATVEPGASCGSGVTATGTAPKALR